MVNDNYCVFALAILAPEPLTIEQAFTAYEKMDCDRQACRHNLDELAPEIIRMREQGFLWREIGEAMFLDKKAAASYASRYKRRHGKVALT